MYSEKITFVKTLIGAVYGKRGKGRPKTRYSDNIREFGGNRSFADLGPVYTTPVRYGTGVISIVF